MRGAPLTRILAALVTLLFFAGVVGTSGLDALLFHGAGAAPAVAAAHYEPGGATNHHADQCLLALRLANGRSSASLSIPIRFEGIPSRTFAARPPAEPHGYYTGLHQQSRAPPAPVA